MQATQENVKNLNNNKAPTFDQCILTHGEDQKFD